MPVRGQAETFAELSTYSPHHTDKPRIFWGVKRGRRLVCKELVTDEETIKEVLELVEELKRRVEKHRGKPETAAFIDELIDLLEQWLEEHKEDKGKKVKEARKIVRKMVELLEELREKWVKVYWRQLLELVELLERNAIDIVVTGKGNEKSLVVHIYSTDVTVKVTRVAKNGGITMHLVLSELEGDDVRVANMFSDEELLKAIQHGWEMTDGSVINDHPAMGTNQPWQAILWTLCYTRSLVGSVRCV